MKWEIPGQGLQAQTSRVCKQADTVMMFMGFSPRLEGEEMKDLVANGFSKCDCTKLILPDVQLELMKAVDKLALKSSILSFK